MSRNARASMDLRLGNATDAVFASHRAFLAFCESFGACAQPAALKVQGSEVHHFEAAPLPTVVIYDRCRNVLICHV